MAESYAVASLEFLGGRKATSVRVIRQQISDNPSSKRNIAVLSYVEGTNTKSLGTVHLVRDIDRTRVTGMSMTSQAFTLHMESDRLRISLF